MAVQDTYDFPDHVTGTTLAARTFSVLVNGAVPSTPLSTVAANFKQDGTTTLALAVGSGFTVTSSTSWQFTLGPLTATSMQLAVGYHTYDLKMTDSSGTVDKYVRGSIKILPSETT